MSNPEDEPQITQEEIIEDSNPEQPESQSQTAEIQGFEPKDTNDDDETEQFVPLSEKDLISAKSNPSSKSKSEDKDFKSSEPESFTDNDQDVQFDIESEPESDIDLFLQKANKVYKDNEGLVGTDEELNNILKDNDYVSDLDLKDNFDAEKDAIKVGECIKGLSKRCLTKERITEINKRLSKVTKVGEDNTAIMLQQLNIDWLYSQVFLSDWKALFQKLTEFTKSKVGLEKQKGKLSTYKKSVDLFYKTIETYRDAFLQVFSKYKKVNPKDNTGKEIIKQYKNEDSDSENEDSEDEEIKKPKTWYQRFINDMVYYATKQIPRTKNIKINNIYTLEQNNPKDSSSPIGDTDKGSGIPFDENFKTELFALGKLKYEDVNRELIASEYISPQIVAQRTLFKQQNNFGAFSKYNEDIDLFKSMNNIFRNVDTPSFIENIVLFMRNSSQNFWECFWQNGNIGEKHLIKDSDYSKRMTRKVFRNMMEWNLFPDPCIPTLFTPTSSMVFCERNLLNGYYFIDRIVQNYSFEDGLSDQAFKNYIILDEFQDPVSWSNNWATEQLDTTIPNTPLLFSILNETFKTNNPIDYQQKMIDPTTFNNYYIENENFLGFLNSTPELSNLWANVVLSKPLKSLNEPNNNLLFDYISPPSGNFSRNPFHAIINKQDDNFRINEDVGNRFCVWIIDPKLLDRNIRFNEDPFLFAAIIPETAVVEFQTNEQSEQNLLSSSIHLRVEIIKDSKINFWWKNFKKLQTDPLDHPELAPNVWKTLLKNGKSMVWDHWCSNLLNIATIVNGSSISTNYNGLPAWLLAIFKGLFSFQIKHGYDSEKFMIYLDLAHLRLTGDLRLQELMYYLCEYLDFGAAGPTIQSKENESRESLLFNNQNFKLQQYELYQQDNNENNQSVLERFDNNNIILFRPFPTKKELFKIFRFTINNLLGRFGTRIYNLDNLFNYLYFDETLSTSVLKSVHTPAWKGKSQIPSKEEYFNGTNFRSPGTSGFVLLETQSNVIKTIDKTNTSKYKTRERNGRKLMESLNISTLIWRNVSKTKMKYFIKNYFNELANRAFFNGISFQQKVSFVDLCLDHINSKIVSLKSENNANNNNNESESNFDQDNISDLVYKNETKFGNEINRLIESSQKLISDSKLELLNSKGNKVSFYLLSQLCEFNNIIIGNGTKSFKLAIHPVQLLNYISKNLISFRTDEQSKQPVLQFDKIVSEEFKLAQVEIMELYDEYITMKDETNVFQQFILQKDVRIEPDYITSKKGFIFEVLNQTGPDTNRDDDVDNSGGKLKQIKKQGDYLTLWKIICNKVKTVFLKYFDIIIREKSYYPALAHTNPKAMIDAETGFGTINFISKSQSDLVNQNIYMQAIQDGLLVAFPQKDQKNYIPVIATYIDQNPLVLQPEESNIIEQNIYNAASSKNNSNSKQAQTESQEAINQKESQEAITESQEESQEAATEATSEESREERNPSQDENLKFLEEALFS